MIRLIPEKLHVRYIQDTAPDVPLLPRFYTLTHSDFSGDLFLSIGSYYDTKQVSGLYTRVMRDEVLAELKEDSGGFSLNVYCHVSGGFVFGRAKWRYEIFRSELSLALEAIRYGDRVLFDSNPKFDLIPVIVNFKSTNKRYNRTENWGSLGDYKMRANILLWTKDHSLVILFVTKPVTKPKNNYHSFFSICHFHGLTYAIVTISPCTNFMDFHAPPFFSMDFSKAIYGGP